MQQELGFSDDEFGNIFSVFSGSLMADAVVWGILVDIMGMQEGFILGVLLSHMIGIGQWANGRLYWRRPQMAICMVKMG